MSVGSLVKNANRKTTKFLEGSIDRLRKARKKASYSANDLATDLVATWGDALDAWFAWVPNPGSPMVPTCVVRVSNTGKNDGFAYLNEDVDPNLTVTVTELKQVGGTGTIAVGKISKKEIVADGEQIHVEIDLTGGGGGPGAGAYQGLAYDATAPQVLAAVLVLVT